MIMNRSRWSFAVVCVFSAIVLLVGGGCAAGAGGGVVGNSNGNAAGNGNARPQANANANQNQNAPANQNGPGNANSGPVGTIPPQFQGAFTVSGNCAEFSMTVAPDGSITLSSSTQNFDRFDGAVETDGSFEITVARLTDDPFLPGDPTVFCTTTFDGRLDTFGQASGTGIVQCDGDPVTRQCAFVISRS